MRLLTAAAVGLVLGLAGEGAVYPSSMCPIALRLTTYTVFGSTLPDLKKAMLQHGPSDERGRQRYAIAKWKVAWSWQRFPSGMIDPESVAVTCEGLLLLPELDPAAHLEAREQEEWKDYRAHLEQHERNHLKHVERVAPEIRRRIAERHARYGSVTPDTGDAIAKTVLQEIRELDRAYDATTEHGKTEGI